MKATHNIWYTGTRHQQYFGDVKPCCMCNCDIEDWYHVIMCGSIDASLHRAASWDEIKKVDGAVASTPILLEDDREGHQPLHITTTQRHNTFERQLTTKTARSYIQYLKEPAPTGIQDKITYWLGQFP
jgi:hypothetical protein